jgi:hypothetical protein
MSRLTGAVPEDLSDPLQVAVKITRMEGTLALLSQQVSQGLGNVTNQLGAMQGEMRDTNRKVGELAHAQHEFTSHSDGLNRLGKSIEDHVHEFREWRKAHETDNRGVSDHVTGFRGALKLVAWAGVFVIALVVFTVQLQFDAASRDRLRIEGAHAADVLRLEKALDQLRNAPPGGGGRPTRTDP